MTSARGSRSPRASPPTGASRSSPIPRGLSTPRSAWRRSARRRWRASPSSHAARCGPGSSAWSPPWPMARSTRETASTSRWATGAAVVPARGPRPFASAAASFDSSSIRSARSSTCTWRPRPGSTWWAAPSIDWSLSPRPRCGRARPSMPSSRRKTCGAILASASTARCGSTPWAAPWPGCPPRSPSRAATWPWHGSGASGLRRPEMRRESARGMATRAWSRTSSALSGRERARRGGAISTARRAPPWAPGRSTSTLLSAATWRCST